ncbi:MAG TPA: bifunctional glutamate N-acetyltransferase/amino-acid acetyltransferase ArgJ [Elusimicrobiota bacterium]|nr:bifunctional glutamate N-acetyltransferase/amino-acid acetyltransferase ArgJ [Elusimicrobiota bacterium]
MADDILPSHLPAGFRAYGVSCGISSIRGKKDLALFYSDKPATAAGLFTTNQVKAAPVLVSSEHVRSGRARAVVINSGCANACTGRRGLSDARWTVRYASSRLGLPLKSVLVSSTGIIGEYLPRPPLKRGLDELIRKVDRGATPSPADAVRAIMTTDTRPKTSCATVKIGRSVGRLWGCAKGAGMIHPNMATMLSVILTDILLPAPAIRAALRQAVRSSFNRVSVDGDTSTNDSIFLLANGAADGFDKVPGPLLARRFQEALDQVCLSLSRQIAADGEGATRTVIVRVRGARTEDQARRIGAVISTSPLFKTAMHGSDPNWGRIMAALGRSGVPFRPSKVDISFGNLKVCRSGQKAAFSEKRAHGILSRPHVVVTVHLHQGSRVVEYATCDFSRDYIDINADYHT